MDFLCRPLRQGSGRAGASPVVVALAGHLDLQARRQLDGLSLHGRSLRVESALSELSHGAPSKLGHDESGLKVYQSQERIFAALVALVENSSSRSFHRRPCLTSISLSLLSVPWRALAAIGSDLMHVAIAPLAAIQIRSRAPHA